MVSSLPSDKPHAKTEAPQEGSAAQCVKTRIEQCAIEIFGLKGFDGTSVREIVEAAGVTKPALYYYFHDKETLYESLIKSLMQEFRADLVERLSKQDTLENKLKEVVRVHLDRIKDNPMTLRLMFRALFGFGAQTPKVDFVSFAEQNNRLIQQVLKEAVEKGDISSDADSEFAVTEFIGMIHIYMTRYAVGFKGDLTPELPDKIVRLFLQGLKNLGK